MLNGIDPIIIFNFRKKLFTGNNTEASPAIPVAKQKETFVDLPVIPIYLSEKLTGIFIDSESKNIDIDTVTDATVDGSEPNVTQKPISSVIKIEMVASKGSLGLSLFSALSDLILPKVTSKEYSITYLHGAVIVFNGLLHSLAISQTSNTDLLNITLELVKPSLVKSPAPDVLKQTGGPTLQKGP